tara:strand:+ start:4023 stop:4787 length:765 start_codon:yes stop_codon:yes gene_type:complete
MDDILICIFHYEERSIDLNIHCWKKLGFKNIKVFSSKSKFHEKLIEMTNFMADKLDKYKLIIKSDADELVFSGIFNLIKKSISTKSDLCHGYFFDKFMNIWRGSGPKIYKPSVFRKILDKKLIIKDVVKPETQLNKDMKQLKMKFECFEIKTCLHEYEQYPSKVLNTLINRYHRGNMKLYPKKNLLTHNEYSEVISYFLNDYIVNNGKDSKKNCHYDNYSKFDKSIKNIEDNEIEHLHNKYLLLYNEKLKIKIR